MPYRPMQATPARSGCFSPFGCGLVVVAIIICVILTVYPNSPFRPNSSGHPAAQPTPVHQTTPKQATPKKGQIAPVQVEQVAEVPATARPAMEQNLLAALHTNHSTNVTGSCAAVEEYRQRGEV